jgi:hypothetical protein
MKPGAGNGRSRWLSVALVGLGGMALACGRGGTGTGGARDADVASDAPVEGAATTDASKDGPPPDTGPALWTADDPCASQGVAPKLTQQALSPPQPVVPVPLPEPVGPAVFRRLTQVELRNTLRDLLGVSLDVDLGTSWRESRHWQGGFEVGGPLGPAQSEDMMRAAMAAAEQAMPRLPALLPACCTPTPAADDRQLTCARRFIGQFGRRAFRRPLLAEEGESLLTVYQHARADIGYEFPDAIRVLIAAMLQAPGFLYRWELGPMPPIRDGDRLRFNAHELASRLSYLLWASMPDDELSASADSGLLPRPDELDRQARRLLASPRASAGIEDFFLQWLEVADFELVSKPSPRFTPELRQSMLGETRRFVTRLMLGPGSDGRLATLLTSPVTEVDPTLAAFYGLPASTTPGWQQVTLDADQRMGVLTQASVLAAHADGDASSPTRRGHHLFTRLLCQPFPFVDIEPPPPAQRPDQSTRAWTLAYGQMPQCGPCHRPLDQAGFAFESYDGLGALRTVDGGSPVDTSGTLLTASGQFPFRNARELLQVLPGLPEVRECMVRQWVRYLLRREERQEEASVAQLTSRFRGNNGDLRGLVMDLIGSVPFRYRAPSAGEVVRP